MELASTHATELVKTLLNVIALTNMHRASGNEEYRQAAAQWLPTLDGQIASLKRELEKPSTSYQPDEAVRVHAPKVRVKHFLLHLLEKSGAVGINVPTALEQAAMTGRRLKRSSVSSILSRLKNDNVVVFDGDRYKLRSAAPKPKPA